MGKAVALVPTPICPFCGKMGTVEIAVEKLTTFKRWRFQRNVPIQDVFPELSAEDREMIMTGIHASCWEEAFSEEDTESNVSY